jgi:hypothetical protein
MSARVSCRNAQHLSGTSLHKAGAVGAVVKATDLLIKRFGKLPSATPSAFASAEKFVFSLNE